MTLAEVLLNLNAFLPPAAYVITLIVALRRSNRLVAGGVALCLMSVICGPVIRQALVVYLTPTSFRTAVPALNLGETLFSLTGWLLVATAALRQIRPALDHENGIADTAETGNPYASITE